MVDAPVLLAGDIDRGGVFAQLIGTIMLLEEKEKSRVKGLIINKFRGDKTILDPGIEMLEEKSGIPVCGVLPYMQLALEDEDSLTDRFLDRKPELVDIAVIRYPRISNFTDLDVFEQIEGVSVRYINDPRKIGDPDLIILPGSKNTMGDIRWLKENGLLEVIREASRRIPVFGICGGFQMLGEMISDPEGAEEGGETFGIGLLPVSTTMKNIKTRKQADGRINAIGGVLSDLTGEHYYGYEIHMGITGSGAGEADKVIWQNGNVYGTYIHGIFDSEGIAEKIVTKLAADKGVTLPKQAFTGRKSFKEREYDRLADMIREHMDMDKVYGMLREARYEH